MAWIVGLVVVVGCLVAFAVWAGSHRRKHNRYTGRTIRIEQGVGKGQIRTIKGYNPEDRTVSLLAKGSEEPGAMTKSNNAQAHR